MLLIVNQDTKEILAKWDAWYINATKEANEFIKSHELTYIDEEITFMGNLVMWVK